MYNGIEKKYKDMKNKHDILLTINVGLNNELKKKNDNQPQNQIKMNTQPQDESDFIGYTNNEEMISKLK